MLYIKAEREPENLHGEILDIDEEFSRFFSKGIPFSPLICHFLSSLDGCSCKDTKTVYNRFGELMSVFHLSTGCKAAILVSSSDKSIDLLSCGYNARDEIIKHCTSGSIVIHDIDMLVAHDFDSSGFICTKPIDVSIDGIRFTDLCELNKYLDGID